MCRQEFSRLKGWFPVRSKPSPSLFSFPLLPLSPSLPHSLPPLPHCIPPSHSLSLLHSLPPCPPSLPPSLSTTAVTVERVCALNVPQRGSLSLSLGSSNPPVSAISATRTSHLTPPPNPAARPREGEEEEEGEGERAPVTCQRSISALLWRRSLKLLPPVVRRRESCRRKMTYSWPSPCLSMSKITRYVHVPLSLSPISEEDDIVLKASVSPAPLSLPLSLSLSLSLPRVSLDNVRPISEEDDIVLKASVIPSPSPHLTVCWLKGLSWSLSTRGSSIS